mmetsp:Transcript_11274/g.26617  ORF Transcript_11274/g.26617 Transcript_11274/m.26617 type:complete len:211 (+) Transcript_11274:193-825(+)
MAAAGTATDTKNIITLKGSVEIVTEFFGYSINSILYQRGIYPPETFAAVSQYGLSMLVTTDDGLKAYLANVLRQLSEWLTRGEVQKLCVVITGVDSGEVLERWAFNIETDKAVTAGGAGVEKSAKEIQKEIQAIIRQITASVSFLPLLDEPCTFDLLVYTDADTEVPRTWEESDPQYITNSTEVRLRSFTTKVHKVDAMVSYKTGDDEDV